LLGEPWSHDLLVRRHESWNDVDLGPEGPAGEALVLVARAARHDRVSVCGYLVDTFCLGVAGPHDDPVAVMQTLHATVGSDGFAVAA